MFLHQLISRWILRDKFADWCHSRTQRHLFEYMYATLAQQKTYNWYAGTCNYHYWCTVVMLSMTSIVKFVDDNEWFVVPKFITVYNHGQLSTALSKTAIFYFNISLYTTSNDIWSGDVIAYEISERETGRWTKKYGEINVEHRPERQDQEWSSKIKDASERHHQKSTKASGQDILVE